MTWQGNGMGAAWERHAMCESALNTSFKAASSPAKTRKWQIRKRSQICNRLIIRNLQGIKSRYIHTYLPETLNKTHRLLGKAAVPAEHNGHSTLTADSR